MQTTQHIHFIGICGVAMSALAIAFHKKGYNVTGSDKGFYPPISTHLKNAGVEYYPGWHVDKMIKDGNPDLVIVGNVAGSKNPEWIHVQEQNIPYKSYPEAIAEFFVKAKSIVCAGTYGKTTTSTLLTWIFKQHNLDPTYMFGGLSNNDIPAAKLTDSEYSILEGDEYKSARWDMRPKFAHYAPTHLLLTAIEWDHADVYPTEKSYFETFTRLIKSIPKDGMIVMHASIKKCNSSASRPIITYGSNEYEADYQWTNVTYDTTGTIFTILYDSSHTIIESSLLGDYNISNITGCFAMAHRLGIPVKHIIRAIDSFKGIKRRMEKRFDGDIVVIDDIAHSPAKAQSVLRNLDLVYDKKIIAIFEPNSGNRQHESIPGYDNAFTHAEKIIIPRLTKIKQDPNKPTPLDGQSLTDVISKTHDNVKHISDDDELVDYIIKNTQAGDVIVFLGSHGFRGMIEQLIEKIK